MKKELRNRPFSLSPSICQPFVLSPSFLRHDSGQAPLRTGVSKPVVSSVEPETVGISGQACRRLIRAQFDRPVLRGVEGFIMSGTKTFTACITYVNLNKNEETTFGGTLMEIFRKSHTKKSSEVLISTLCTSRAAGARCHSGRRLRSC